MIVSTHEVIVQEAGRGDSRQGRCEALEKSCVADLSAAVIDDLTCDELVRVIQVSELPRQLSFNVQMHWPFYDRETLKRLAYLARRCCQNQGY